MTTATDRVVIDHYPALRRQLEEVALRLDSLLRSVTDPSRTAIGTWSIAETAVHLLEVTAVDAVVAAGVDPPPALEPVIERASTVGITEVEELNKLALDCEPTRDPKELADKIGSHVDRLLTASTGLHGAEAVRWLGGITASSGGVVAHLISEMLIHGRDIATAARKPWPIPTNAARLFYETFFFDVLRSPEIATFVEGRPTTDRPMSAEFRLRGTAPVHVVFDGGSLTVSDRGRGADVRILADPAALLLVMFERMHPLRAALTGRVIVVGRRPWRIRRLMSSFELA